MNPWQATQPLTNLIGGQDVPAVSGKTLENISPTTGQSVGQFPASAAEDVQAAIAAAAKAQPAWAATPPVQRGLILHQIVRLMQDHADELGGIVASETGKSIKASVGEVGGAAQCGLFYASEGQRLYARTTTSGAEHKSAMTVRQPVGVAGLIIASNTPIANVAWKVFPALVCGNAVVLKASEDSPGTAWYFGKLAKQAGLPDGVLNIVHGLGPETGPPLVDDPRVGVVSFTGSTRVGKLINESVSKRLGKVSLELGGKNALVVCDDADLDRAVTWTLLSAFSNAGQRCASGSRIIIFESVYNQFTKMLLDATAKLKLGVGDDDDLGPVINQKQLHNMLAAVESAKARGGNVLIGGGRATDGELAKGFYMQPTLIENIDQDDEFCQTEHFGPIASLHKAADFADALAQTNQSPYGLTACIHTRSIHRAWEFSLKSDTGVAVVNAGTFGSEPHMPFGGTGLSGNGTREPGTEALDIYSDLKDIYLNIDPNAM